LITLASLLANKSRGQKLISYTLRYLCFSTKAIHLEAVSELTLDAFLTALPRFFVSR